MSIDASLIIELPQGSMGPFRPLAVLLLLGVLDKVLRMLVDTEVGQVHVSLLYVLYLGVVLVRGEPRESFVQHVNPQWVVACDQHVDPEVVLEPVDEMGIVNVLRNQRVLLALDLALLVDHLDSPPTCLVRRLHNPQPSFLGVFPDHLEPFKVGRENVCNWDEVVVLWETASLLVQVLPHVILPA